MDNKTSFVQEILNGLQSTNKEQKLLSISALAILRKKEYASALTDLLASPSLDLVEQVIIALGQIANPSSVKHLVEFLGSPEQKLTKAAYNALSTIHLTSEMDIIMRSCTPDLPPHIKKRYLSLLMPYEDIRVASLMNEILGQTRDTELLTSAITYFIKYPSAERHTLLKMLSANNNWNVSLMAHIALSRLKDEGAHAQVKKLAKSASAEVRAIIINSLIKRPLIEDREMFQIFFDDSNQEIREKAIHGLALFATDERISILRNWIAKESDSNFKIKLIAEAEKEKSTLLYDEIFKLLQSSDELMQKAATKAIVGMGEKIVDRILIDFDRMPLVIKEQMIVILGQIGDPKVIPTIKSCLFAKERWLRINAIEATSTINSPELNEKLIKMVNDPNTDIWVMATAVSAMGKTKNPEFVDMIVKQLAHEDARVRANAVEALTEMKWPGLSEECLRMLIDKNDRVRVNSAIALWRNGNDEVFNALEKMAADKSRWVRASAVFALGKIKDKSVTPILLTILSDHEDMVYRNVIEALADQGDLRALIPLLKEAKKERLSPAFYEKALARFTEAIKK
jgi:HEAT repeat protein